MTGKCPPAAISSTCTVTASCASRWRRRACASAIPGTTPTRRSSSCSRPRATRRCSPCSPSLAFPPTPATTCSAGASVIGNLSASNIIIGKEGYRHQLAANQSARCLAAYLYSAAGIGESTTDLAWDGHAIIYENGTLLAESQRFAAAPQLALADVDLDRLLADRMRQNTFAEGARRHPAEVARFRSVEFSLPLPRGRLPLERRIGRFPYVL